MTGKSQNGESKEGEGSGRSPRADQVLRQLVADYSKDGIDIGEIRVQRVTGGLFAVHILEHGQHEAESFFLRYR